jgi:hypothetical protein
MVSQMKNTARVKVAHTLGGQDVVIGKVEGVGLEIKVTFLIKERGTTVAMNELLCLKNAGA